MVIITFIFSSKTFIFGHNVNMITTIKLNLVLSDTAQNDGYFNFTPQPCSSKIVVEAKKDISSNISEGKNIGFPKILSLS